MNCNIFLLLYMYIVYYSPLNLLDIGHRTIISITSSTTTHCGTHWHLTIVRKIN